MHKAVDVIIIGLNSSKTLPACLDSIKLSRYPQDKISVYYADGGSYDGSIEIAESRGAHVLLVDAEHPTPGGQRNAGWKMGTSELVQFLDSDTIMNPDWFDVAQAALAEGADAVCGNRKELHPERSTFNWIGDQEWNGKSGFAEVFGGDVLVRRSALEATGGYNSKLVAGEDPEFSYRVRRAGFRILKLDTLMTRHDLSMYSLRQYWKRAYRSGYGFTEVHFLHRDFWTSEVRRIGARGGAFLLGWLILPFAFFAPWLAVTPLVGTTALFYPRICRVERFRANLSLTKSEARIYAWHASFVILPQFFGMLRYIWGRLFSSPLTNKRN